MNEESLLTAIKKSDKISVSGAWYQMEGYDKKFQASKFAELLNTDVSFSKIVHDIIDEEVIRKFENKTGKASDFYDTEEEVVGDQQDPDC